MKNKTLATMITSHRTHDRIFQAGLVVVLCICMFGGTATAQAQTTGGGMDESQRAIQDKMAALMQTWSDGLGYVKNTTPRETLRSHTVEVNEPGFVCKKTTVSASDNIGDFPLFASIPANIFPGSVIQGNTLETATFGAFTGLKGSGSITVSTPSSTVPIGVLTMDPISNENYDAQLRELVSKGLKVPANISFEMTEIYSQDHLHFAMSADVTGDEFSVDTKFKIDTSSKSQYLLLTVTQVYFTVKFNRPPYGAQLFAQNIPKDDLKYTLNEITETNPPLYVSSMDYGRKVFVLFESLDQSLDMEATLAGGYKGVVEANVNLDMSMQSALQSMSAKGFFLGGSPDAASNAVAEMFPSGSGTGFAALENIKKWLREGGNPNAASPPAVLTYNISLLMDGSSVRKVAATKYVETDCDVGVCPSGYFWATRLARNWIAIKPSPNPEIAPAAGMIGDVVEIPNGSFYYYAEWARCNRVFWQNVAIECVPNQRADYDPKTSPPGVWTWHDIKDKPRVWSADGLCDTYNVSHPFLEVAELPVGMWKNLVLLEGEGEVIQKGTVRSSGFPANPDVEWHWKSD